MRAPLNRSVLALLAGAAVGAASAATPLAVAERQVVTIELSRPVARLAVTDPDVVALSAEGARVRVTGLRAGRATVEVVFDDGAVAAFAVEVEGLRRPEGDGPGAIGLAVGEERRLAAPGVARVLLEENGVARVRVEPGAVLVLGTAPGTASLVVIDAAGARTSWSVRVR